MPEGGNLIETLSKPVLDANLPPPLLNQTRDEQRMLGERLVAKPAKETLLAPHFSLWENFSTDSSESLPEGKFTPFFNSEAGKVHKRRFLVAQSLFMEEEFSDILSIFSVFGEPAQLKDHGSVITYLPISNLYLINKQTNRAIDLASVWYSLKADMKPERIIGLLPYQEITEENKAYQAIVPTNWILFSDTGVEPLSGRSAEMIEKAAPWDFEKVLGLERSLEQDPQIGKILAAASATQKRADMKLLQADMLDRLLGRPPQAGCNLPVSCLLRFVVDRSWAKLPGGQEVGFNTFMALTRNAYAATLSLVWRLRKLGFDLFPGKSNKTLISDVNRVVGDYAELLEQSKKRGTPFPALIEKAR